MFSGNEELSEFLDTNISAVGREFEYLGAFDFIAGVAVGFDESIPAEIGGGFETEAPLIKNPLALLAGGHFVLIEVFEAFVPW